MRYVVFGNYINPWTIARGLRRLGLRADCIAPEPGMLSPTLHAPAPGDALFFAEEDSLLRFLNAPNSDEYHFYPHETAIPPDDKLAFSRFLSSIEEKPVPFWELNGNPHPNPQEGGSKASHPHSSPQEGGGVFPFILKARHSWLNGKKLVRGSVCHNRNEYENALWRMEAEGLPLELFFLQKFVPGSVEANLSVSGFFDCRNLKRNLMIITRKRLGDGGLLNTGAIVEIVHDPACLLQRTERILSALHYRGPFELEFLYDAQEDTYYVLELNMRFWMQHGLFIEGYENRLLNYYLEMDTPGDWLEGGTPYQPMVWLDTVYFWRTLFTLRFGALRQYAGAFLRGLRGQAKVCLYPGMGTALAFILRRTFKRLFRRGSVG
jgi:hypothetical protein